MDIIYSIIGVILFIFWIFMILDVIKSSQKGSKKIIWLLIVIFLGPLGAGIYYFLGR